MKIQLRVGIVGKKEESKNKQKHDLREKKVKPNPTVETANIKSKKHRESAFNIENQI